jgi:hypothetical protein
MPRPTFVDQSSDKIIRYWSCPVNFVSRNVAEFIKMLDFLKSFPASPIPPYQKISRRFMEAWSYYEAQYTSALEQKK